jgi:tetraacyldisaccharide 4'-kinase
VQERWEALVTGEARGLGPSLARGALRGLSALYAAGLRGNLWIYEAHLKPRTKPALPVVSVGNLSLGGTGKTTTTAFLAGRLATRCKPGIVLRGYRRSGNDPVLVVSDGTGVRASVEDAGDEAVMLAQMLPGCALAVGKRREHVVEALAQAGAQVALLDDGFQYFRMERALDIVLLDALGDAAAWQLFPAGRLREPPGNLRRAHQVWITHADLARPEDLERLRTLAARHAPGKPVVLTRHRTGTLRPLQAEGAVPGSLRGRHVAALSALGNPGAFEGSVEELGAQVTPVRFADHHRYAPEDWGHIARAAQGAELIVTTEKDAVKLPPPPAGCVPVAVLPCELEILEGEADVSAALDRLTALI